MVMVQESLSNETFIVSSYILTCQVGLSVIFLFVSLGTRLGSKVRKDLCVCVLFLKISFMYISLSEKRSFLRDIYTI